MSMVVKIGSIVKFYTILLLNEGPKHGYDLMKELKDKLGRDISPSQVYPFLGILEKNKFVVCEEVGERDKKVFKITKEGREFVNGYLHRFGNMLYLALEKNVSVCAHCGCKILEGGHIETVNGKELVFCCCHCAKSYKEEI